MRRVIAASAVAVGLAALIPAASAGAAPAARQTDRQTDRQTRSMPWTSPDPPGVCFSLPGDFRELIASHSPGALTLPWYTDFFTELANTFWRGAVPPERTAGYATVEEYGDTDRAEFTLGSHRLLVVGHR